MADDIKLIEWAEQIPMDELYAELRKLTGIADLKFTTKIRESNGYVFILFESQDLADQVGFLKLMFKEIRIANFNSKVYYDTTDDEERPRYYGTACFDYSHPSGGSNGCTFLTFWYDDRKGWEFELR